jgi:hypothetical protein
VSKLPRYFQPLQRANLTGPEPEEVIKLTMEQYNLSREEARTKLNEEFTKCEYWVNDRYQVELRRMGGNWVQLNIRARDGRVILQDWRHFQAIKNQLVGPECEAVQIYPAESRLVDTSNKYHLWCNTDPEFRFPIGFDTRDVDYNDTSKTPGLRQRSF